MIPRRRRGRPSSSGGRRGPGRVPGRAGQVCFIPTLLRGLLRGPLAVPRAQGSSAGCSPLLAAPARFSTFLFLLPLHLPPSLPLVQRPSSTPLTAGRVAWVYARRWLYLISFPRSISDSPACPLRCHTGRGGSPSGPAAWAMRTVCVGCACVRAARVCALTETKVIGLKTWVCRGRVLAFSCFHVESAHSQSSCLQQPRPLLDQRPVHS